MKFQKSEYTGNSYQVTSGIKKDKKRITFDGSYSNKYKKVEKYLIDNVSVIKGNEKGHKIDGKVNGKRLVFQQKETMKKNNKDTNKGNIWAINPSYLEKKIKTDMKGE